MGLAATLRERFAVWALRASPPEPVPVVFNRRRVYILPTRAGIAFGLSLIVMLLGAVNYNLSLGHALTFLLAGLGIVAIMHTFRNLIGLRLTPGRAEPVFAGDTAHFAIVLANPSQTERRLIQLRLDGGSSESVDLPAAGTVQARLGLPTHRRGWLPMPRVTVDTTYPLGLARAWSYAAPQLDCLVYPKPMTAATAPPLHAGANSGRMQQTQGNEDFAGLRSHQPADPPRHVAWKAAARMDDSAPLLTKQFSGAAAETLWLDWDDTRIVAGTEQRIALLARWVVDAADAGASWGLRLPATTLPPAGGNVHRHACLKALALHEAD